MGFFGKVRETFRDHARDNICVGLQTLGIDAQMAPRGRAEEEFACPGGSLGIIDIREGPIRWVNVRKVREGERGNYEYYTEYGVPDPKMGFYSPSLRIKLVRKLSSALFDPVEELRWEGGDLGLAVIERLNSDVQLKQPIIESRGVTIDAHGEHRCWIISTRKRDVPSEELWNCYQTIARHLLAGCSSAIAHYTKAIELDPNDAAAYYNRGFAYANKGEYDKAIADVEKCIELSDDFLLTVNAKKFLEQLKKSK